MNALYFIVKLLIFNFEIQIGALPGNYETKF